VIVDDSEPLRRTLRGLLGSLVCGEAENGQQAIQRVLELQPDLILLDYSMPVMNGLEAAKAIRKLAPKTKIVVFSLHTENTIREEALRAGADVYLNKTSQADQLLGTIAKLLAPMGLDFSAALQAGNDGRAPAPRDTAASS
jgi:two-component system, chemotaxis family, chemotaxis protein CheY